ncbi:MAG: phosphoglycerate kinase [Chloroflexi bacterium]|nr:phosphoglycerate kinase [Chloroflexota bacterium]
MPKKTVRDVDVHNKRVLDRVDFNVPLDEQLQITDDKRIRESLPTIKYLIGQGARLILASHLGRPKGKVNKGMSLKPAADRLAELLAQPVKMASDCVGPEVEQMAKGLKAGEVLLLENLRFHPEEEENNPEFARQLASLADIYVNDAFGSAHRAHASTEGVAHYLPAVAGFLMEKELNILGNALNNPQHPFIAILGGAKISDKIGVIRNLLNKADTILIGGGMANTFLKAKGLEIGDSLVEAEALPTAQELLSSGSHKLVLPFDVVIADAFDAKAQNHVVQVSQVPPGWRILDIGPATIDLFREKLKGARTVVWNGPMGVFEFPPFAKGTNAIAHALADLQNATTIIGGGDSAAAIEQAGLADKVTHVSTGGGASLEFLEGLELPGVITLNDR